MPDHHTIIKAARQWCGTPYCHQASLKGVGCDCLGLIRGVWRELYGGEPEKVPGYSASWAEASDRETLALAANRHMIAKARHEAAPGDMILFRWKPSTIAKHAGILSSTTTMIHAQDGAVVCEVDLNPWWWRRCAYVFSFPTQILD